MSSNWKVRIRTFFNMSNTPDVIDSPSHDAFVSSIEDVNANVRVIRLKLNLDKKLSYRAGQYVYLQFQGFEARPFSIANKPGGDNIEFHITYSDSDMGQHISSSLRLGEAVTVMGPYGNACLDKNGDAPILLLAGGTGLAPAKAIIEEAAAQKSTRPISMYYGVRTCNDVYGLEVLQTLARSMPGLQVHVCVSDDGDNLDETSYRKGTVIDNVLGDFETLQNTQAYVFGSKPMVENTIPGLIENGLPEDSIFSDVAGPSSAMEKTAEVQLKC